ncbi:hypothetical protein CHUAL_003368 [Chamberlinius hualienensis]
MKVIVLAVMMLLAVSIEARLDHSGQKTEAPQPDVKQLPGLNEACGDIRTSICMKWCGHPVHNITAACKEPYMCCVLV